MNLKAARKTKSSAIGRAIAGNSSSRPSAGRAKFPLVSAAQIALLRKSFVVVSAQSDIAALVFYRHLFTLDSSLKALFHTSIELQGRTLMEALEFTLATLENPGKLVPVLEAMGRRHVNYGAKHEHYTIVTEAMLQTLRELIRDEFTPAVETAWKRALEFVSETMIRGAGEVQELLNTPPAKSAT